VALIIAVVALAASCRRSPTVPAAPAVGLAAIRPGDETGTKMAHYAEQAAIDAGQRFGTLLDFTPQSVESVEKVLDSLTRAKNFQGYDDKDTRAEALIFGAYIGEVIRREHGGEWSKDHLQAGPATYPLHWDGHDSFPYNWCYKRLTQGESENVWHKYQYFVMKKVDPNVKVEVTNQKLPQ